MVLVFGAKTDRGAHTIHSFAEWAVFWYALRRCPPPLVAYPTTEMSGTCCAAFRLDDMSLFCFVYKYADRLFPNTRTKRQRVGHLRRRRGHHLVLSRRRPRRCSSAGGRGDDEHGLHRVPARRDPCAVRRGQEGLGAGPRRTLEEPHRYCPK